MRGWRPRRVREWPDLAVPVVLTALEGSITLAEAMEARGYGSRSANPLRRRSPGRGLTSRYVWLRRLAAIAFVALRLADVIGDWYPFPTISVPPVNGFGVACLPRPRTPGTGVAAMNDITVASLEHFHVSVIRAEGHPTPSDVAPPAHP